jgi:hypothetical protein
MDTNPKSPKKYEAAPANNYRTPGEYTKPHGRPRVTNNPEDTFNNSYLSIYEDFRNDMTVIAIAQKYNVSRQTAHLWKKSWLAWIDFSDEPPVIKQMKLEATKVITSTKTGVVHEKHIKTAISRSHTEVDKLRLRFMDIANTSLDRIEQLIAKEKSVGNLAKLLGAVLPYVATKQDGDSNKGMTPDEKRTAFIQNKMNVYNISTQKSIDDGTTEDSESEWIEEE